MVDADPAEALAGAVPRLFDEWQVAPAIWNQVRRAVDERGAPGQFILTGSAVPADDITRHTGLGGSPGSGCAPCRCSKWGFRAVTVPWRPRGRWRATSRAIGPDGCGHCEVLAAGGWPGNLGAPPERRLRPTATISRRFAALTFRASQGKRDPVRVGRLLRSLARNVATPVSVSRLASETGGSDRALKADTVADYLDALERLMVVENQPAWSPPSPFADDASRDARPPFHGSVAGGRRPAGNPGAATGRPALPSVSSSSPWLSVTSASTPRLPSEVFHYREKDGLEVDAIVDAGDGRWAAFEVKLGERWVDEGRGEPSPAPGSAAREPGRLWRARGAPSDPPRPDAATGSA